MRVPFGVSGDHMLHRDYGGSHGTIWKDFPKGFMGHLKFVEIHKYSSNVTTWIDTNGVTYWMSQNEFEKSIQYIEKGCLTGKFEFRKQGRYYSISYVPES